MVGHSLRFLVERGRVRQTAGRPVRKSWLVALSVLAGCPNQIRRLLGQRVAVGFSRGQLHLLEPDRVRRVRIYEIRISRRPSIELEVNRATLQLTGATLQGAEVSIQSRFFSAIRLPSSVDVRAPDVH